jgi:DNA-binding IclR family transcriptional regulator
MVGSVRKALDILEIFSFTEPRLTLAQISQRLKIPKSTAHNLLRTLAARGYVERPDRDHYALGTAIYPLTQAVRVNVEVRDRAAPLLRQLADSCRASSFLVVPDNGRALYVYAVESPQRLRARTLVGERFFLHCTGVGKAILAFLPSEECRRIVATEGLPAFSPTTITSSQALARELAEVRSKGYAIDRSEHEPSTYCIAAPILDDGGRVIGSCSISGSDPEIVGIRLQELAPRVTGTAEEISRRMGYVPVRPALLAAGKLQQPLYTRRRP